MGCGGCGASAPHLKGFGCIKIEAVRAHSIAVCTCGGIGQRSPPMPFPSRAERSARRSMPDRPSHMRRDRRCLAQQSAQADTLKKAGTHAGKDGLRVISKAPASG
jgi:hypothetical protein